MNDLAPQFLEETRAQDWAKRLVGAEQLHLVTDHAWARTYRLKGSDGTKSYLKLLPAQGSCEAQKLIAERFTPDVPALLDVDVDRGWLLFADHRGTDGAARLDQGARIALLHTYGTLQSRAQGSISFSGVLPHVSCNAQFDRVIALLQAALDGTDDSPPGNPFLGMGRDTVSVWLRRLRQRGDQIRLFLQQGDSLPKTINHGDLRGKNVALLSDDKVCIFDWDDAAFGPVGLSLHAQFSGCHRVILALAGKSTITEDADAIDAYIDALCQNKKFSPATLRAGLGATAMAGVFRYIAGFAPFAVNSASSRKSTARNCEKRLADLWEATTSGLITAHAAPKRASAHAKRARATGQDTSTDFPAIRISDKDHARGRLRTKSVKAAADIFRRDGTLLIENAFPKPLIEQALSEFHLQKEQCERDIKEGAALRVGDKRFMLTLDVTGAFADPQMMASPMVLPIIHELLGNKAILGSYTAVASMPGAKEQRLHRDNPPLFEEARETILPSFCIALIIPLIPLTQETGATRVIKGSHRNSTDEARTMPGQNPVVDIGACYLMDSRLFHQGMANNSKHTRPIVSVVYQRPWYRDHKNFRKQQPVRITPQVFGGLTEKAQKLLEWTQFERNTSK